MTTARFPTMFGAFETTDGVLPSVRMQRLAGEHERRDRHDGEDEDLERQPGARDRGDARADRADGEVERDERERRELDPDEDERDDEPDREPCRRRPSPTSARSPGSEADASLPGLERAARAR